MRASTILVSQNSSSLPYLSFPLNSHNCATSLLNLPTEMRLHGGDVWGHFAPLFHLVDVFAVYACTLVGGRHVMMRAFSAVDALCMIGERIVMERYCNMHAAGSAWVRCRKCAVYVILRPGELA